MIETLYKTQTPEKGKSECYVLVLTSLASGSGRAFAFMEEHGQWDDDSQRYQYKVKSINAEEQLTYQLARSMYETAKSNLAAKGFVHSFTPNGLCKEPFSEQHSEYRLAMA